jgi:asparagine synthase (glutamine-hydrolysing)
MRVPFLDPGVVRAAWRLPPDAILTGGGKQVTRRFLQSLVPGAPPRGAKQGFTFPWERWLRGPLRPFVQETLHNSPDHDALGLDRGRTLRMFEHFLQRDPAVSWLQVWSLFVLLRWQAENRASGRGDA